MGIVSGPVIFANQQRNTYKNTVEQIKALPKKEIKVQSIQKYFSLAYILIQAGKSQSDAVEMSLALCLNPLAWTCCIRADAPDPEIQDIAECLFDSSNNTNGIVGQFRQLLQNLRDDSPDMDLIARQIINPAANIESFYTFLNTVYTVAASASLVSAEPQKCIERLNRFVDRAIDLALAEFAGVSLNGNESFKQTGILEQLGFEITVCFENESEWDNAMSTLQFKAKDGRTYTLMEIAKVFCTRSGMKRILDPIGTIFDSVTACRSQKYIYIHDLRKPRQSFLSVIDTVFGYLENEGSNHGYAVALIGDIDSDADREVYCTLGQGRHEGTAPWRAEEIPVTRTSEYLGNLTDQLTGNEKEKLSLFALNTDNINDHMRLSMQDPFWNSIEEQAKEADRLRTKRKEAEARKRADEERLRMEREQQEEHAYHQALEECMSKKAEIQKQRNGYVQEKEEECLRSLIRDAENARDASIAAIQKKLAEAEKQKRDTETRLSGLGFLKFGEKKECRDILSRCSDSISGLKRQKEDAERAFTRAKEKAENEARSRRTEFENEAAVRYPFPQEPGKPQSILIREEQERKEKAAREVAEKERLRKEQEEERKRREMAKGLDERVMDVLRNAPCPLTVVEIMNRDEVLAQLSNQKVAAVIRGLGARVERVVEARVTKFKLP